MTESAIDYAYEQQPDNRDLKHIPGEYGLPYIGKAIQFLNDLYGTVDYHYKKFGPVSRLRMGGQEGLLVVGPDLYQQIYLDKDKNFSAKMGYDANLGSLYPDTILLSDFEHHRPLRRMFQGAFKNAAMKNYVEMMNPVLNQNIATFAQQQDFHFFPAIKKTLLDVAAKIFVGIDELGEESDRLAEAFVASSDGLLGLVRKDWPGLKFHRGLKGVKYQREYFAKMIPARRKGNGGDTFTYLCKERDDDGNLFSDEAIINQMTFLLFAAHDTTTSALSHMVYYTALHPEWQERMRNEVKALNKPFVAYDDLEGMNDIDMVFHEALRLHPSVPMMTRRTIRECELGGYRVPANTVLFLPPTYNHHMKEYWSNPDQFDPERFSPARQEQKKHSFQYLPFGGGAHKCIGMHFANMVSKAFMMQFLQQYSYALPANYSAKITDFPLPHPADGLKLQLTRR